MAKVLKKTKSKKKISTKITTRKVSVSSVKIRKSLGEISLLKAVEKHRELQEKGYTVIRNVFKQRFVEFLLKENKRNKFLVKLKSFTNDAENSHDLRTRKANQMWSGAVKTIDSHIKFNRSAKTLRILAPVTSRGIGRYDLPLPKDVAQLTMEELDLSKILPFLRKIVPKGYFTAQNILVSKKGSERQSIHIDYHPESREIKVAKGSNIKIQSGYVTVLIPLTKQTNLTGGTRIWPGSHKQWQDKDLDLSSSKFLDCVSPIINIGDCLLFDGFLAHCGMENKSQKDRYFYYAAFSNTHDPNTEVTGY